jgi:hypothetical protein
MDVRKTVGGLVFGVVSLTVLGACSSGAGVSPSAAIVAPTAAPPATSLESPSPSPSLSPEPTLAWHHLTTIPASGDEIQHAAGFDKGYVALERRSDSVWFSADGRTWRKVALPFETTEDKYGNTLGPAANTVTSNGTEVLVVGGYAHKPCRRPAADTGGGLDCPQYPVAWISDDGLEWQSAYPGPKPAAPSGYDQGSEFVAAWPVPTGGWDAALSYWQGESLTGRDLWHSSDGIHWTELAPAPAADVGSMTEFPFDHAGAADQAGRRVVWEVWFVGGEHNSDTTLATSPDGMAWTPVPGVAGPGTDIEAGVGPTGALSRWVLVGGSGIGEDYTSSVPTAWTSDDRLDWTATVLPFVAECAEDEEECGGEWVTSVVPTSDGYVAGSAGWYGSGEFVTWSSEDGLAWVRLPFDATTGVHGGPGTVLDGPAGVIGVGLTEDGEAAVWQLR